MLREEDCPKYRVSTSACLDFKNEYFLNSYTYLIKSYMKSKKKKCFLIIMNRFLRFQLKNCNNHREIHLAINIPDSALEDLFE